MKREPDQPKMGLGVPPPSAAWCVRCLERQGSVTASLVPLTSTVGRRTSRWGVAAWLALPLRGLLAFVASRLPGVFHPSVLDRWPVSSRPAPGSNVVDGAPDPVRAPTDFVAFLSARLDGYWNRDLAAAGVFYRPPQLRLFDQGIQIPCFPWIAFEDEAPFYCFLDDTIYLPVPYVSDVARTAGDGVGRMALAYVLAHEYAHHVQHLTGLGDSLEQVAAQGVALQRISVTYELQADCLAGVWAASVYPPGALHPVEMGRAED